MHSMCANSIASLRFCGLKSLRIHTQSCLCCATVRFVRAPFFIEVNYQNFQNSICTGMELAQQRLQRILQQCNEKNIDLNKINAVQRHLNDSKMCKLNKNANFIKLLVLLCVILYCTRYYYNELQTRRCALELPRPIRYALRPPERCDFCANIEQVDRVHGISSEEFESKYAYSGAPVIVEDATKNWTALTKFDYWYFRDVYRNAKRKQKILDCQFLPYKTGFRDIYEALDMPAARVNLAAGEAPWYFGWSNCNSETAEEFRRHYGRPYFLPTSAENNAVDWFFIGTAGLGAHMHIDNVRLPSWQAQLAGSKRWLLVPPPECYLQCKRFDVVVKQGDMIVIDTNKWYHQTFVEPGVVSLTIGAEYD